MKELDVRGLSCPEPVLTTAKALKATAEPIKVLVSEPHQRTNVESYAKKQGRKVTSTQSGSDFILILE